MIRKLVFGFLFLGLLVISLLVCNHYNYIFEPEYQNLKVELPTHYSGKKFASSESCIPCHESIYKTHISTAHYNTSALADNLNLLGQFNHQDEKINVAGGQIRMLQDAEGSYQITKNYKGKLLEKSKIDIVIGSGVKGQSHLTFKEDSLYQLQTSYLSSSNGWINSPGFPNYRFQRPVMDNCIKCHVTFAKNADFSGNSNVYDKNSFIYGVDCERCHGPAQDHVDFRTGSSKALNSDPIVRVQTLNRQQQMDACAQCHAGLRSKQVNGNPFSFLIGENLEEHSKNHYTDKSKAQLDVHGNQYGLLVSSSCFKESADMSCVTCHDPHKNQRNNAPYFNSKCLTCHEQPQNLHATISASNLLEYTDCIKCHMPEFPSRVMKVMLTEKAAEKSINVRTHLIGIYIDSILQK